MTLQVLLFVVLPEGQKELAVFIGNFPILILIIGLAIFSVYQGYKVVKHLNSMQGMKGQLVVRRITWMAINSSVALIVSMIILALSSWLVLEIYSYPVCGATFLVYRALELMNIGVITIPLRNYQVDKSSSRETNLPRLSVNKSGSDADPDLKTID